MNLQGYYCVAFLDLLGTDATNRSISERKQSDPEGAAKMLAREVGKVKAFREGFFNMIETLQKSPQAETISEAPLNRRDSLRGNPIKYYTFSDSSIIHCSLTMQQGRIVPVKSCFWMLLAVALAQLQELAQCVPFRGGIEVDFAASHSDDGREILGPALSGAVELEKCGARFPRVAIGEGVARYLGFQSRQDDSSEQNRLNKTWAKMCMDLICEDTTGVRSIDITAPSIAQWIGEDLYRTLLDKSVVFAREQLERHNANQKIAEKYEMLVAYLTADRE
jgi:hypothetical protein